ncbi:hypothetical protein Bca52824_056160 [Brassica carinata]|uniref:Uncharacterized protein n=1 Tax=Brassica carinata TaxID=52824 RepID=A0A8X7QNC4_BRACI|nr:hypothetical protein Bca52824_056160 [Brassica carinata]
MMTPSDYGTSNGVWSRFLAGQQENKIDYDVSSSCGSSDNKESVSAPSGESGDAGERLHRPEVEEETGYLEMENLLEIDDLGLLIGKNGDFKNWCCDEFQHAWNCDCETNCDFFKIVRQLPPPHSRSSVGSIQRDREIGDFEGLRPAGEWQKCKRRIWDPDRAGSMAGKETNAEGMLREGQEAVQVLQTRKRVRYGC